MRIIKNLFVKKVETRTLAPVTREYHFTYVK